VLLPPWRGKGGWGETRGRSAPPTRTPTPPSPVEGEGLAPRLPTTLVPNSIAVRPRVGLVTWQSAPVAGLAGEYRAALYP
jgi:hypothetical protein